MFKDFDKWNSTKKRIESRKKKIYFKEGDIWWAFVGINLGVEVCGKGQLFKRPVLILCKLSKNVFIGIPITSLMKQGSWFTEISVNNEKRWVLLWQIKIFSVKRLEKYKGRIRKEDLDKIKNNLKRLLKII